MRAAEYRYWLTREVTPEPESPIRAVTELLWIMLNPSTADEYSDDQTIRSVKKITAREGFNSLMVVNLFAARTTYPRELLGFSDPIGPENGDVLRSEILTHPDIVFAWGTSWADIVMSNRRRFGILSLADIPTTRPNVEAMAKMAKATVWCLGTTKNGSPKHPCRIPHARLEPFHG